jgi:hypothetical protein
MILRKPMLWSIVAGLVTWFVIGTLESHLPSTSIASALLEDLALPGALVASIPYPQGVHTGRGAPGWARLVILANMVIYILVWYLIIKIVAWRRGTRTVKDVSGGEVGL